VFPIALAIGLRLDEILAGRATMRTRETTPLWVWLTFGLLTVGMVMYLTGYFVIEDILAFFK
jgi:hypothetical protein